jgi:hypothetical protein
VIRRTLFDFEPGSVTQQIAHGNVLRDFNELMTFREQRLTGVGARLPGVLWYTVAIGAVISIILLLLLEVRFALHLFVSSLITFFLGVMVFLVFTMDRPLRGENAITPAAYVSVYEQVMRWDEGA